MANYTKLKDFLSQLISPSYTQDATGALVQESLDKVVDTIMEGGRLFKGIVTPATNPRIPDADVFYIAYQDGTYTNFGGITIKDHVAIIYNLPSGEWTYQNLTLNESGIKKYAPGGPAPEKPSLIPITHFELVRMICAGELIPGQKYLIEDYEYGAYLEGYQLGDHLSEELTCEVIQQTVGNSPSLVVEAISKEVIDEEATIFYQAEDPSRFTTARVRYCPIQSSKQIPPWLMVGPFRVDFPLLEKRDHNGRAIYIYDAPYRPIYTYEELIDAEDFGLLDEEGNPLPQEYPTRVFAFSVWNGFTGAVTWMRDEFGNEAPFDFKLYQFTNFSRLFAAMLGLPDPTEVVPLIKRGSNVVYRDICPMLVGEADNVEISYSAGFLCGASYSSLSNCVFKGALAHASVRNVIMPNSPLVANYSVVMGDGKSSSNLFSGSLDYGAYIGEDGVFTKVVGGGGSRRNLQLLYIPDHIIEHGENMSYPARTLVKMRADFSSKNLGDVDISVLDMNGRPKSHYVFHKAGTAETITLEWIAEPNVIYRILFEGAVKEGKLANIFRILDVLE